MGWTCMPKPDGPGAVVRYMQGNLTWESETVKYTCLRGAFVGLTYYAAVECINKTDGSRSVFAAVNLVRYQKEYGEPWVCFKELNETMGPNEARCPKTIFDLLTPLEPGNTYAQGWRDKCAKYHALHSAPITDDELSTWAAKHGRNYAFLSPAAQKTWKTVYRNRRASGQI
jgi:hypothetical protein